MYKGSHEYRARKSLIIKLELDKVKPFANDKNGTTVDFSISILRKEGIRPKRIHDFSTQQPFLHNLKIIVEGKTIYCNKQIVALNSEFFMEILFPDGSKELTELKMPDHFKYDKILRLIKVFYDDSDALTGMIQFFLIFFYSKK
uniref:BTB domain-containing protein n=1 Tax=Caenorhabditis japonica TaxID=281687 RepID=A0A8R1ED33_CAEJA